MSKKRAPRRSTIENRVYVFTDLAAAFIAAHGGLLASGDEKDRTRARRALSEIAHVACVVSDTEDLSAAEVREQLLRPRAD